MGNHSDSPHLLRLLHIQTYKKILNSIFKPTFISRLQQDFDFWWVEPWVKEVPFVVRFRSYLYWLCRWRVVIIVPIWMRMLQHLQYLISCICCPWHTPSPHSPSHHLICNRGWQALTNGRPQPVIWMLQQVSDPLLLP